MARNYEGTKHDIKPKGLNLANLAEGGNVMTDGCNGARKFNRMMVDTIRNSVLKEGSVNDIEDVLKESINDVIVQSITEAVSASQNVESNKSTDTNPATDDNLDDSDEDNEQSISSNKSASHSCWTGFEVEQRCHPSFWQENHERFWKSPSPSHPTKYS